MDKCPFHPTLKAMGVKILRLIRANKGTGYIQIRSTRLKS